MSFVAFLDANVIYPAALRDVLLYLAKEGIFQVRSSPDVLEEMERNVANRPKALDPEKARQGAKWVRTEMERAFPEAMADKEAYVRLMEVLQNDPKDRHVLAAAIVTRADVIVTFNDSDFPGEVCSPYGIEILDPDSFLVHQLSLAPEQVLDALRSLADKRRAPMDSPKGILSVLERQTPRFSTAARALLEEESYLPFRTVRRLKVFRRPPRP